MFVEFLYAKDIILIVVIRIKVCKVEITILQYYEDALVIAELTDVVAMLFVVDSVYVGVEPYLTSTECGVSVALQSYAVYGFLRQ